jgi:hypothetical protein
LALGLSFYSHGKSPLVPLLRLLHQADARFLPEDLKLGFAILPVRHSSGGMYQFENISNDDFDLDSLPGRP